MGIKPLKICTRKLLLLPEKSISGVYIRGLYQGCSGEGNYGYLTKIVHCKKHKQKKPTLIRESLLEGILEISQTINKNNY